MKPIIIIDNGHGYDTPGKRSPEWSDGSQLLEYEFNRDVAARIVRKLSEAGIAFKLLVPEVFDVSLSERCERANRIYEGSEGGAVLFSIHANAGGGSGWECYTTKGETESDRIATILCEEARKEFSSDGFRVRFDYSDGDPDKESDFYILKHTKCPAVLSENFFYDNEKECKLMMNEEFQRRIARMHVKTIKKILE